MNTIKVKRDYEGRRFEASARYAEEVDGWYVSVGERIGGRTLRGGKLTAFERRGPVNDAWSELEDMLSLAMGGSYDPERPTFAAVAGYPSGMVGGVPKLNRANREYVERSNAPSVREDADHAD